MRWTDSSTVHSMCIKRTLYKLTKNHLKCILYNLIVNYNEKYKKNTYLHTTRWMYMYLLKSNGSLKTKIASWIWWYILNITFFNVSKCFVYLSYLSPHVVIKYHQKTIEQYLYPTTIILLFFNTIFKDSVNKHYHI